MENNEIKHFLHKLIIERLPNNLFAKVITTYFNRLDFSKKDKFYESLVPYYSSFKDEDFHTIKIPSTISNTKGIDVRLKTVKLSNVRGIDRNKPNYGLNFFKDNKINNAIILGPNGTGKSSVYSALEYMYTNKVGEYNIRRQDPNVLSKNDYIDFLGHLQNIPNCEIDTPIGTFDFKNTIHNKLKTANNSFDPDILFINDYDIYSKGQKNFKGDESDMSSFHYFVASSLGMKEYLEFNTFLKSFATYKRTTESRDINKLESEKNDLLNRISEFKKSHEIKSSELQNILDPSHSSITDRIKNLNSTFQSIQTNVIGTISFTRDIINNRFQAFDNLYEQFLTYESSSNIQEETEFLTTGLSLLFESDDCPFCNSSKLRKDDIKILVEKRIKQNKETSETFSLLRFEIDKIETILKDIFDQASSIKVRLSQQNNSIAPFAELSLLVKVNTDLITFVDDVLLLQKETLESELSSLKQITFKELVYRFNNILSEHNSFLKIELPNIPNHLNLILENRQSIIQKIDDELKTNFNISSIELQRLTLEKEIRQIKETLHSANSRILSIDNQITLLNERVNVFKQLKDEATQLSTIVDNEVNNQVANLIIPLKDAIESVVQDYFKDEEIKITIELQEKLISSEEEIKSKFVVAKILKIDISTGKVLEEITPTKYFNTFRYRLFCTIISLSIAIVSREKFEINTPLVIDDIFYASDYNNKTSFADFFRRIIAMFKKHNYKMPLQFILFTHDDIVFEAAVDAIKTLDSSEFDIPEQMLWIKSLKENTKLLRIFPPRDADIIDSENNLGEFWDLTVEIPYQIFVEENKLIEQ